jgi:pimeloyl-ACP methyl ester carboxylesterase
LPGHGKSAGHGLQTISSYLSPVLEWMDAVGLPQAIFAGHSMGSAITMSLGIEYPGRVRGWRCWERSETASKSGNPAEERSDQATYLSAVGMVIDWAFSPTASNGW